MTKTAWMTGQLQRAIRCYRADLGGQILDQTAIVIAVAEEPAATGHAGLAQKSQMPIASWTGHWREQPRVDRGSSRHMYLSPGSELESQLWLEHESSTCQSSRSLFCSFIGHIVGVRRYETHLPKVRWLCLLISMRRSRFDLAAPRAPASACSLDYSPWSRTSRCDLYQFETSDLFRPIVAADDADAAEKPLLPSLLFSAMAVACMVLSDAGLPRSQPCRAHLHPQSRFNWMIDFGSSVSSST